MHGRYSVSCKGKKGANVKFLKETAAQKEYNKKSSMFLQTNKDYYTCYVYFHQVKDKNLSRGYYQKSASLNCIYRRGCSEMVIARAVMKPSYFPYSRKRSCFQSSSIASIADNSRQDLALQLVSELRSAYNSGSCIYGLDIMDKGNAACIKTLGMAESWSVNRQVLASAAEAAEMISQNQSNGYQLSKIKIDKSNHRLIFSFPYVKEFRDWEIEFNPFHPELGPDLLLKDEELAVNEQNTLLDVDSTNILTWDPWNYLSINKLVDNLLKNHLQNQMRLLKSQAEKVALELEQLNAIPWLENTQISVSDKSKDQITVKLLAVLSWKNENFLEKMKFCSIEVLFQVMYLNMQCVHITSEVYLPLHFYELLNKPKMIHVATETTTLLENLHRIKEHVMEMVMIKNTKITYDSF
ncbi:hypothetical protein TKK_0014510 [Trichogramma kaykai]